MEKLPAGTPSLDDELPGLLHAIHWQTVKDERGLWVHQRWVATGHTLRFGPFKTREEARALISSRAQKYSRDFLP